MTAPAHGECAQSSRPTDGVPPARRATRGLAAVDFGAEDRGDLRRPDQHRRTEREPGHDGLAHQIGDEAATHEAEHSAKHAHQDGQQTRVRDVLGKGQLGKRSQRTDAPGGS